VSKRRESQEREDMIITVDANIGSNPDVAEANNDACFPTAGA
jgi:hypothetical protein